MSSEPPAGDPENTKLRGPGVVLRAMPDRLSGVLAAMAGVDGDAPSVIDRVCVAATRVLSLSGAGLSLMVDGELRGTAGATGPGIGVIQELQLSLGQGPCVDACASGDPVTESDLADPALLRWPAFAQAAAEAGVRAVFAFPLRVGAIRIGVLALYRDRAGGLSADEFGDGLVLAEVAVHVVLGLQAGAGPDTLHALLATQPTHWAEVHQATGMISAQLGVSLDEAFVRLRAASFAENRQLREVAGDVVARRLRLERP
jgi:GAF domain/ANTAR domain